MNKMIINILLIVALISLTGCVLTKGGWYPATVNDNGEKTEAHFEFKTYRILYPFKLEGLEFDPSTGMFKVINYDTDGGAESAKVIAEAVAAGVVKGIKGL